MDIDYLLALQNVRQSLPGPVETLASIISYIGDGPILVAISLVIYWCIDKRMGLFAMVAMASGNFVNQLMKNLACIYRPWIRDPRIIPAESALEGAGGYSFPSGHCTGASTIFGSLAWLMRKKHRVLAALCIVLILVIAFTRNFLGVHTPQDVIVGLLLGVLTIVVVQKFFNWLDRYDAMMPGHKKDVMVAVIAIVVSIASIAVVVLKPYPMDYVDGQLLVDPVAMQKGSFEAAGLLSGLALGWILERRLISFTTDSSITKRTRIIRGVIGVGIVGIVYLGTNAAFKALLPLVWAKLCAMFLVAFVAIFIVPLAFNAIEERLKTHPDKGSE